MIEFTPDSARLPTASHDKTVRVWDAASGQPLTDPLRHDAPVVQVGFHPDGERLLASTDDGLARIWDMPDFKTPAPAWLPTVAEAISFAEPSSSRDATLEMLARYGQARAEALAAPADDAYAQLARSLFRSETGRGSPRRP